jgi:hypothetical protein
MKFFPQLARNLLVFVSIVHGSNHSSFPPFKYYAYPEDNPMLQYVTLDLDGENKKSCPENSPQDDDYHYHWPSSAAMPASAPAAPTLNQNPSSSGTVYKTVDFLKTAAFNETRKQCEEEYRRSQERALDDKEVEA